MKLSAKGLALIKEFEKLRLHPYLDIAGIPTIGYGTTVYANGKHVTMGDPAITEAMADAQILTKVGDVADAVSAMIPPGLTQNQFDALVSFAYNVGTGALHGSTALRLIKANPKDPGIRAALAMWNKVHVDGKLKVSKGLTDRREKEADLYFS